MNWMATHETMTNDWGDVPFENFDIWGEFLVNLTGGPVLTEYALKRLWSIFH